MNKKQIVESMLDNGFVISEDLLESLNAEQVESLSKNSGLGQMLFLNKDILKLIEKDTKDINWNELERIKSIAERDNNELVYKRFLECVAEKKDTTKCIVGGPKILFNYTEPIRSRKVKDFVMHYNARFRAIEALLKNRQELQGLTSIARVAAKRDRENVSIVGIITDKSITQNGHVMLTLEDTTGSIKVLVSTSKAEQLTIAKNLVFDEIIGVTGVCGDKIVFCSSIIHPDVPLHKELKKLPHEEYALFFSDLHVGSNHFLHEPFEKFLKWINGEIGTAEHKNMIKKIKHIFIAGDLVAGVGIYPNQESELEIMDIYEQYQECARLLKKIPNHIQLIMCPGNHDSTRLSEPQPAFEPEYVQPLMDLPNTMFLSNPAMVNICSSDDFPGFDVLLYHGYSFDYYISNVDDIRNNGGYDRADLVMKFLLQRRHLSPSHSATLYIPDEKTDPLVISKVPDFFVSGHIHKSSVSSYRNVSLICGSCWESTTPFQERVGHNPEPAQVPMVNLQTRKTRILRF